MNKFFDGQYVTVSSGGDLRFNPNSHEFIDELCVVVKYTKSGLVQVRLAMEPNKTFSVRESLLVSLTAEQINKRLDDYNKDEEFQPL